MRGCFRMAFRSTRTLPKADSYRRRAEPEVTSPLLRAPAIYRASATGSFQADARGDRPVGRADVCPFGLRWAHASARRLAVLALHVFCVRAEVGAGLEETVIEVEVQVMGLDVVQDEHGRHRARELAERVEDELRLQRHASFELVVVVDLRTSADTWAVAPGAGGIAV